MLRILELPGRYDCFCTSETLECYGLSFDLTYLDRDEDIAFEAAAVRVNVVHSRALSSDRAISGYSVHIMLLEAVVRM